VLNLIPAALAQAESTVQENDAADLYPKLPELVVGAIAFAILFFFMWKWVLPRVNTLLEERRQKIQGEIERAEQIRGEADTILEEYRQQLAGAREESGRIIEESRRTAEQLRRDAEARAEISVELAARIVGQSLDEQAHQRLIDEYIDEVAGSGNGQG
jgi:F-type H+-transporting ATPase subunit b